MYTHTHTLIHSHILSDKLLSGRHNVVFSNFRLDNIDTGLKARILNADFKGFHAYIYIYISHSNQIKIYFPPQKKKFNFFIGCLVQKYWNPFLKTKSPKQIIPFFLKC